MNLERHVKMQEARLESVIRDAEAAIESAKEFAAKIATARDNTLKVLAAAEATGVDLVGIGVKHAELGNEEWSFPVQGSIFTKRDARDANGWPVAWHIARAAGISEGAGNTGQHQIESGSAIDGLYRLKDGVWYREDVA